MFYHRVKAVILLLRYANRYANTEKMGAKVCEGFFVRDSSFAYSSLFGGLFVHR